MAVMLLEWSFTSMFLILVVLALRWALGKRVSARLRYALWAVVLVRLLVPVQLFTSPLAGTRIFTGEGPEQGIQAPSAPSAPAAPGIPDNVLSLGGQGGPTVNWGTLPQVPDAPAVPDAPEPPAAPDLTKLVPWLGRAWLAGSVAVALALLASNLRFYWKLRRERIPLEGTGCPLRVYVAVGLPSPCLFGVLRPAIYVTPETAADPDMLRHVLAHEHTHYRQGDHLWSLLRCGALAAHWWDPLVWLAAVLSQRDAELACDEGALKRLGDGERAGYGNTLLALVTAKPRPADLLRCATTMAGDKKSLKERIARIARAPKRVVWAVVVAVLVTALACVCAFGQAEPEEDEPDDFRLRPVWAYGVSEMTYVRDAGGFGGDFTVTLRHDGSFTYYEGPLSSYIGMGTWGRKGDVIRLADEGLAGSVGIQYYYFERVDGGLEFQAENSAKFMYLDVADGERFSIRASRSSDEPTYTMNGDRNVLVEGLDGAYVEWSRGTDGGSLYLAGDLGYFCPKLAGEVAEGGAYCERDLLYVRLNVDDERIEDGAVGGFGIFFTVDQTVDMVYEQEFTSMKGDTTIELTDQEMVDMARALAEVLIGAEEWYNSHAPQPDTSELLTHFTADVSDVPAQVLDVIGRDVLGAYEQYLRSLAEQEKDGNRPAGGWPEFDGWRVEKLEGPWTNTVLGMDLEIWRINYEYHTPEPDKAKFILAGGMYVTAAGWLCPTYPDSTYYVFDLDETGGRSLAAVIPGGGGGGMPDGETRELRDSFYQMVERVLAGARTVDPNGLTPDLDRNGVPETIRVAGIDGGQRLELYEGGELIFSEEGYSAHAGYNALFLCTLDGEDYLLRYSPYMGQGWCTYSYQLFTLENGRETVARENSVEFDVNFQPGLHESFDVNAIADFMNEINGLLAHSVQLLNTDEELLGTFEKEGRLYDSLWWLDTWEPVFTREAIPLADNLWAFQAAMEKQYYAETPVVTNPSEVSDSGGEPRELKLAYRGKVTWFRAVWESFYGDDTVYGQLIDLDGDGRMEIVFSLQTDHGTGVLEEGLHVFDAETLEEYDCSGVPDMVLRQVTSYADEERFYITAPVEAVIEKPRDLDCIYNDQVDFGRNYCFQVKNGKLYGCFRAGVDRTGMCYLGELWVELRLENGKPVCAGFEYLPAGSAPLRTASHYLAVLRGEENLFSTENFSAEDADWMTLDELLEELAIDRAKAEIIDFTVLDLDGDGGLEVVLGVIRGSARDWCIVLHEQGGAVYANVLYIRWLNTLTLKEDGAFCWSSSAFENGWGKLRFTETGCETIRTIWVDQDGTYHLGDKAVSQAEYDAANGRQEAVPDAVWYTLNEDNIFAAFFKG